MAVAYEAPETATRMLVTAMGLLDTLTAQQHACAVIADFDDPRRLDWDIIPRRPHRNSPAQRGPAPKGADVGLGHGMRLGA